MLPRQLALLLCDSFKDLCSYLLLVLYIVDTLCFKIKKLKWGSCSNFWSNPKRVLEKNKEKLMDFSICTFNLLHYFSNFRALYYAMMAGTVSLPCGEPWHFFLLPWYSNTMMICTTTADPYNLTSTCWTSFEPQSKSQYWVMTSWIKYGIYCCGAILNAKMLKKFLPIFQNCL